MKNFIQINNFSDLHDGSIIFCKTDYLLEEFSSISQLNKKITLISGNSDYSITDYLVNIAPLHNIKKWYAQNALAYSDVLYPIPMGIENKFEAKRFGHGIGYYDRVNEKEVILNSLPDIKPSKFIYSNFNVNTNYGYRTEIKNLSQKIPHIDWEEPNLDLKTLFHKYLSYKMILCPIGNGIDTHRLWEVLYCNRIPITIKSGNFKIYDMYKNFPIIVLEEIDELYDFNLIQNKYQEILSNSYDSSMLGSDYWKGLMAQ